MIFKCTNKKNPLVIHRCRFDQVPKWLELTRNMFNAVGLLDAPTDSVIDNGIIYKLICLIFFMVKVYYLVSTSFLAHLAFRPCELLPSLFICRPSTFHIVISSSKTTGPIAAKLWWNGHWTALFQNCVRWSRLSTKMAAKLERGKRGY